MVTTTTLESLGWSPFFEHQLDLSEDVPSEGTRVAARVAVEHKSRYELLYEQGSVSAIPAGRLRHRALSRSDLPAVGDWVVALMQPCGGPAIVEQVLERKSKFSRTQAGPDSSDEQILAANIDTVFLVTSLNMEFNLRRTERYLALAWESGADPVVLLNKADLCADPLRYVDEVRRVAGLAPTHVVSATTGTGIDDVASYVGPGQTCALLGSSGVGKSTLVNALLGEERQVVREIREDDHEGRHTTTHRELIALPTGGLIIDTPGMRELQMYDADEGISAAFADVEDLAEACRYRNCEHQSEPGCAVQLAMTEGDLEPGRFESYLKMQRELAHLIRKQDKRERANAKSRWKQISKANRKRDKLRGRW